MSCLPGFCLIDSQLSGCTPSPPCDKVYLNSDSFEYQHKQDRIGEIIICSHFNISFKKKKNKNLWPMTLANIQSNRIQIPIILGRVYGAGAWIQKPLSTVWSIGGTWSQARHSEVQVTVPSCVSCMWPWEMEFLLHLCEISFPEKSHQFQENPGSWMDRATWCLLVRVAPGSSSLLSELNTRQQPWNGVALLTFWT